MSLLSWLFPPRCMFCGALLQGRLPYCAACAAQVCYLAEPVVLPDDREQLLDRVEAAVYYTKLTGKAIKGLKFRGRRAVAEGLAQLLANRYAECFAPGEVDFAIPVPLHKSRRRWRGFNQSELLCSALPVRIRPKVLQRIRETKPQSSISGRAERLQNLQGAFSCPHEEEIRGKCVLLVDDVCTTGATLMACAAELKRCGAERVYALTVMRTDRGGA